MSTPPKKVSQDQRAEEVYYTQELLTEIFAAPITDLMQESAQQYILTGKFKNLVPAIQTSMQALWDRAMYAGIADAEYEIDNLKTNEFNLSSFSNQVSLIEFAKDPQLARIDGELKDLQRYLQEAQSAFSAKDVNEIQRLIDIKRAERDQVKNPNNPKVARKIAEKIRLERELDAAKRQGNFDKVQEIRNKLYQGSSTSISPKPPSPVSEERPEIKKVITTKGQINRTVEQGRAAVKRQLGNTLSFDPNADLTADPYASLFEGKTAKAAAETRLLTMNNLQVYATLNERYPAIARNSIFAQDYLQYRQNTVATSLQQQYQEQIKSQVAKYVAQDKASGKPEQTTLNRIRKTYQDDKLNVWYKPFISQLEDKYEASKLNKKQYEQFLKSKLKQQGIDPNEVVDANTDALVEEEERLSLLPNPTKKQQARMAELERLLDEAASVDPNVKAKSKYQTQLRKLAEEDDDKRYINPDAKFKLSRLEKERLIKLGRYDDEKIYASGLADQIRGQEEFSYKQIRSYISDLKKESGRFDESLYQIAARTAATETAAAYSIGRLQTYIERGVNYVQWIATMDARTSVFCQSLHRKIFAVRDLIPAAMAKQTFPKTRKPEWDPENQSIKNAMGINTWMVPAHPYCRSFLSPIYTDDQKVGDKYPPKGFPPDEELSKYLLTELKNKKGKVPFDRLTNDEKRLALEEIVQSQNKMRESKTAKILKSMGNLQDMFNMGLSYLTRRLKQDKIADFTVDEIKRNDKQLVSALVGGAAVLGTGAIMYFFMKSNLARTLTEYLKLNAGIAIGGLTKDAVSKLLKDLIKSSKTANSMPDSVKDLIGEPVVDTATLGEKLELATQNGELVFEMAATGQLTIDEINQLISAGVTGVNRQGKINALTRSALNSAMNTRRQLNESALNILNQAFVNKGGAIDPTKITSIQDFANVYRVGIAGQRGTFVSKKAFDAVMGSRDVQQELGRLQEQIERIEAGLDGLESIVDPDDEIGQALLRQERAQQRSVKAMIDSIRTKMASPDYINARSAAGMQESFTPEISQMVNQVIQEEANYKEVLDRLLADFAAALPSNRLIQGLIPENIDSVTELKALQKLIKDSIREAGNDFLDTKKKGKPPYTPATAARKRNLSSELLDAAQRAENQALRLNNQGFTYNSNLSDLDKYYRDRINSELQTILELDTRISNRIKELE